MLLVIDFWIILRSITQKQTKNKIEKGESEKQTLTILLFGFGAVILRRKCE
jgi:hypothetical protein